MSRTVYINDIQAFLPNEAVDNEHIEQVLGQIGSRPSRAKRMILRSNKIKTRHYALDKESRLPTHTNAQLAAEVVQKLHSKNFDINHIELLACGTTMADQLMPNHALMVHGDLKIPSCEVIATAGICLSATMALKYAYLSVMAGECDHAVATGSENCSSLMRSEHFDEEIATKVDALGKAPEIAFEKDFLRWMLSDGAGAARLSPTPNAEGISLKVEWIVQKSYANEQDACMYAGAEKLDDGTLKGWRDYTPKEWAEHSVMTIKQDVKQLNEHIINYTVTKPLKALVESGKLDPDEIDYFLPHYSSGYFRDKVYDGMKEAGCDIAQEKWFTNLTTKGNTGSASIFIILEELFHSGRLKAGDTLLCYIPESGRFSTAFMKLEVV